MERKNAAFRVRMGEAGVVFSVLQVSEVNCYSGKFTSPQLISIKFCIIHSKSFFSECRRSIHNIRALIGVP